MASRPTIPSRSRVPVPAAEYCLPSPVNNICGENVWITAGFALFLVVFLLLPTILKSLKQDDPKPTRTTTSGKKGGVDVPNPSSPVVSTKAKTVQPPQEKTSAGDDGDDSDDPNTPEKATTQTSEGKKSK
ncbi:hypothetical protein DYB28_002488 [Aphanomyces astaci]|uniref:Uncharacterized protein n=1 Tax=Aphanomyces astaci TaxID=112090 RepID=A0A3L6VEY4_APHAT|nr:hypothetical protein AaE_006408 [Aphanomyces astaci]RLO07441.1 hypothetical protein DYB28_002488 [Aphanomyces astaci]